MRDNRASLKQNSISLTQNQTIEKLTYLTIGYLPITLMAVSLLPLLSILECFTYLLFRQYLPFLIPSTLSSQQWAGLGLSGLSSSWLLPPTC